MTDDEIRSLFRDLRDEPIPADSVGRFRSGLETLVERRRSFWRLPTLGLAGISLVLMAGLLEWWPVPRQPASLPIASRVPAPSPIEIPLESPRPVIMPAIIRAPQPHSVETPPPAAVSIRIETPDPNVVILLVGD